MLLNKCFIIGEMVKMYNIVEFILRYYDEKGIFYLFIVDF